MMAAAWLVPPLTAQTVDKPLDVGGNVVPPVVKTQVEPKYPRGGFFHRAKSSDVTVDLVVDEKGFPQNLRVEKSGGEKFDQAALEAVRQYRFQPATREGAPVAVEVNVVVFFRIY